MKYLRDYGFSVLLSEIYIIYYSKKRDTLTISHVSRLLRDRQLHMFGIIMIIELK